MKVPKPRQLQSGRWFIRMRLDGQSHSKAFDTKEEAIVWATTVKEQYRKRARTLNDYEKLLKGVWKDAEISGPKDKTNIPTVAAELELIDSLDGVGFEKYCSQLLFMTGFFNGATIRTTKKTNDYGADIILSCIDGIRIAIQCKRMKESVKINAVQEVLASKNYYHANAVAIITNSRFTKQATELAKVNGVALFDRKILIKLIELKIKKMREMILHTQWESFLSEVEILTKKTKGKEETD